MMLKALLTAAVLAIPSVAAAQDYAQRTADLIRSDLVDPFSVRDAERTPPFEYRAFGSRSVAVCARFYAKNRLGGYTGQAVWTVLFRADGQVRVLPDTNPNCDRYGWRPFPALEGR